MQALPKKADTLARLFEEDNKWLNKRAKEEHTVVAVIVHKLILLQKDAETV